MSESSLSEFLKKATERLAAQKRQERTKFENDIQSGNLEGIAEYFNTHRGHAHVAEDKYNIIAGLVDKPQGRTNALQLFEFVTSNNFDFEQFFDKRKGTPEANYWSIYASESTPDMAKIGAVLVAEYLRYKVSHDESYDIDLSKLLDSGLGAVTLSEEARRNSMRNSVLATQNTLVAYLKEEGDILPANRGASFLKIMGNDLPKGVLDLCTHKITGFRDRKLESIKHGEIIKSVPVFEPQP